MVNKITLREEIQNLEQDIQAFRKESAEKYAKVERQFTLNNANLKANLILEKAKLRQFQELKKLTNIEKQIIYVDNLGNFTVVKKFNVLKRMYYSLNGTKVVGTENQVLTANKLNELLNSDTVIKSFNNFKEKENLKHQLGRYLIRLASKDTQNAYAGIVKSLAKIQIEKKTETPKQALKASAESAIETRPIEIKPEEQNKASLPSTPQQTPPPSPKQEGPTYSQLAALKKMDEQIAQMNRENKKHAEWLKQQTKRS